MRRDGTLYGLATYSMWGVFPLFFRLLERSGYLEIIAYRVLWSLACALLLVAVAGQWRWLRLLLASRHTTAMLGLAGLLVTLNWTVYVYGVNSGHTLDAALGYFINPLFSAGLGILVNREKLRALQRAAFAFGALAVLVLVVAYGKLPWIALMVALSFSLYALVKNRIGMQVRPLPGMVLETAAPAPLALGYVIWLSASGHATGAPTSSYGWLMMLVGPVTLIPLVLFAAAAQRVSMTMIAMLQYITPTAQFLIGWLVLSEPMPGQRWAGFVLIWIGVALFAVDALRSAARIWPRRSS